MDQGTMVEYDSPYNLMMKMDSIFHEMCVASGNFQNLLEMAKDALAERESV